MSMDITLHFVVCVLLTSFLTTISGELVGIEYLERQEEPNTVLGQHDLSLANPEETLSMLEKKSAG